MTEKKRIFIVDDDKIALTSLEKLLALSGFEVKTSQSPKDVIALIKAFAPHLIILDLVMPGLGGLEVCQMLNADESTRGIPIIVVSALGKFADIKKAYAFGVINYFVKPYDFKEVLREINKALSYKEQGEMPSNG